ncbi:MAG: hypothetical protein JO250_08885 [Armatimonadetes bacterium]|nr:hypothetical protein [Armatimonadota bacterium]
MNSENSAPEPVPMTKEKTVKEDGRFLYYYSFPPEAPQPPDRGESEKKPEDADV